jgi:integrase
MPSLNATAFFDPELRYYRARFWSYDLQYDSCRKVKESYWFDLGIDPIPATKTDKFDRFAQRWADREAVSIEKQLRSKPAPKKKTLLETWELYKEMNPDKVTEATITRSDICARNVKEFLESQRILSVLPEDVDIVLATKYRNWREKDDVSPRTLWNELTWLKQMASFAFQWQSSTGAESLRLIRLPYVEMPENDGVALTEEEFGRLLEKIAPRDQEILAAGVTTRVRKNNLLGLRGEWFDRPERWLHIPKDQMKGTRGKKRPLSVPVATWTLDVVADKGAGLLWPNERTGTAMGWYEHVLEKAIAQAHVRPFSLHDLRTTGNSWLDRAGVDKLTRKVLMGHSPKADVTDLYTKKFVDQLRGAVEVYDQIRGRNGW